MYVKLFSKIIRSSIWAESSDTRIVWVTMLLLANRDGIVEASPSGLAREANVSLGACRDALKVLESPDLESATQEYGGRRIEATDGGWQIINYMKYRELRDADTVREQTRERVRRHREKKRSVTPGNAPKRQAEAEADTEKTYMTDFHRFWNVYPKRSGDRAKGKARKAFTARVTRDRIAAEVLIAAAERYRRYCEQRKVIGTEYVKQASTFLSPTARGWEEDYDVPAEAMSTLGFGDDDFAN